MNYRRTFQISFLTLFFLVAHASIAALDQSVDESGQGCLQYVPDSLRVDTWWNKRQERIAKEQAELYVGEKPSAMQIGHYKHGRFIQFSFDMRAFFVAMFAGSCFRGLYSVSTCGTEYKKFKQAAFTPGVAKSFLFWVPAVMAYQFVVNAKDHEAFVQKMSDRHGRFVEKMSERVERYNPDNQFGQDKVD